MVVSGGILRDGSLCVDLVILDLATLAFIKSVAARAALACCVFFLSCCALHEVCVCSVFCFLCSAQCAALSGML